MTAPDESNSIHLPSPLSWPQARVALPSPDAHRFWYWAKRFLACNPFYLTSAMLLLFGLYRLSVETSFRELNQLLFNFSSLQLYEVLLVVTAIFLARRRIWYDSTLLIGLEIRSTLLLAAKEDGSLLPQRRWLPAGVFSL